MGNRYSSAAMILRWLCILLICVARLSAQTSIHANNKSANSERLQEAADSISAGNLAAAERELRQVLRSAPDEYRALDLLGIVRVLQHDEKDADRRFREAIRKKPDFAPAHAHLGLLCAQDGHPEEAVLQLREAVRLDPARSDASVALVRILQDQAQDAVTAGAPEKALALLTEASKYAPENADVQFALGTVALQMTAWQIAMEAFQKTLHLRANDPIATYDLGRALMGLSNFEDAQRQFARYVELRPDDASGHCALGMTLAALEHSADARAQFERSIVLAPSQTESYFRLALLDLDANDLNAAARNLTQVLSNEPKHPGALAAMGRIAFQQKRYAEAFDLLHRAITNDDSLHEAHYYLGLTYARLGRKQESDEELQIATRLEHDEVVHRRTVLQIADPTLGGASPH